jgi:hypothetical protein
MQTKVQKSPQQCLQSYSQMGATTQTWPKQTLLVKSRQRNFHVISVPVITGMISVSLTFKRRMQDHSSACF